MNWSIDKLNEEQYKGLAKLCFDLAKGTFALVLFTPPDINQNLLLGITKIAISILGGLAFAYMALLLLKLKELAK